MRMMVWIGWTVCLFFSCLLVEAQSSQINQGAFADSLRVERWLAEAPFLSDDSCRVLYFARRMLGVSYVAGTLDAESEERLIVRTDAVDCVTFVETVLALTMVSSCSEPSFAAFKNKLQFLRYRDGRIDGYVSRLHYFSDWVRDNERKGLVRERTAEVADTIQILSLNFMTAHASAYPAFKNHPELIGQMANIEQCYQQMEVPFVKKSSLGKEPDSLPIKNGDVLAITTSLKGLDVVHLGFACWIGKELHLLHASSNHKKVVLDSLSLYDYSRTKKTQTGIRVVEVLR